MKKFFRSITSVVAVLALVVAIPIAVYVLQNQRFDFKINAFLNDEPKKVMVVNNRGNSATVVWQTEKSVIGSIVLTGIEGKIYLEEESVPYHLLEIINLEPGREYAFKILSDGKEYSDPSYVIKTNVVLNESQTPYIVFGQIFNKDGTGFQTEGLVLIQLQDGNITSQKIPAQINKAGGYQINLTGLRSDNGSDILNFKKSLLVSIFIYSEINVDPIQKKYTLNFENSRQIPNIYLGDINIDSIPGINGD